MEGRPSSDNFTRENVNVVINGWFLDYTFDRLWNQFKEGNGIDTDKEEQFVIDLLSQPLEKNEAHKIKIIMIIIMIKLTAVGNISMNNMHCSNRQVTLLEEVLSFIVKLANCVRSEFTAKLRAALCTIISQAVYECCRRERFDLAKEIFERQQKVVKGLGKRGGKELLEVIEAEDPMHPTIVSSTYKKDLEFIITVFHEIYLSLEENKQHPGPFLVNAAEELFRRKEVSSLKLQDKMINQCLADKPTFTLSINDKRMNVLMPNFSGKNKSDGKTDYYLPKRARESYLQKLKQKREQGWKFAGQHAYHSDDDEELSDPEISEQSTSVTLTPQKKRRYTSTPRQYPPDGSGDVSIVSALSAHSTPKRNCQDDDGEKVLARRISPCKTPRRRNQHVIQSVSAHSTPKHKNPHDGRHAFTPRRQDSEDKTTCTTSATHNHDAVNQRRCKSGDIMTPKSPDQRTNLNRDENWWKEGDKMVWSSDEEDEKREEVLNTRAKTYKTSKTSAPQLRVVWSYYEEVNLYKGVQKYGVGKWASIRGDPDFELSSRTGVNLKDKWRNMVKLGRDNELKEILSKR